jgi:phosphatidate cytidylyltransferase
MKPVILIMSVHFIVGAAGIFLTAGKLSGDERKNYWLKYFSYLAIFILIFTAASSGRAFMMAASILICAAGLIEILIVSKKKCNLASKEKTVALAISVYITLAVLFSAFLFLPMNMVIYTYILVVIFDGASQVTGRYSGNHKIAPVISPSKTVEGFAGGMISSVVTGLILHNYAGVSLPAALFLSLLICSAAFCGDIAASYYKRVFNTKDFSRILPGQGGVLDRFDSFIFAGATMGIAGYLFVKRTETDPDLAAYLAYSIGFLIVLFTGEAIQYLLRMRSEYSRVISHMITGFMCIFMIRFFSSGVYIILFCIQSAAFIYASKKLKLLNGLNGVQRNTDGGTYFFAGIIIAYAISGILKERSLFILPVLVMTFCDPAASMTGMNLGGSHNRFGKTLAGSAAFLVSAFGILFAGLIFYLDMNTATALIIALCLSLLSAVAEYLSGSGLDNITVPAIVSAGMMIIPGIF